MSNSYPGGILTAGADTSYSVAFDGSGDYLSIANTATLKPGTGDFTWEAWLFPTASGGNHFIFSQGSSSLDIYRNGSNKLVIDQAAIVNLLTSTNTVPLNAWTHYAFTRSGTTTRLFVNGVLDVSGTSSVDLTNSNATKIGESWPGFISNTRFIKGTALYTTNFTPPTQLLPITNTSLLTCQSPTIIDNSANAFAITVTGDAKVSNFTPFAGYKGFNPALGAAAGGVWTLEQATSYQSNRTWPIYDPYYNYNTLLLRGNGSNTATNSTFTDGSSNNFTITRNGNTTQGSFSPFSQTGWSVYSTGSSSYVRTPSSSLTALIGGALTTTSVFTFECWVNLPTGALTCGDVDPTANNNTFGTGIDDSGYPYLGWWNGSTYTTRYGTGTIKFNTWTHVAWVVNAGTVYFYINGVAAGSGSIGSNSSGSLGYLAFFGYNNGYRSGYISNFCVTKAAKYTSNFTQSTKPLTAEANTTLLVFQDNRFVDNSANNFALTTTSTISTQAFSPFVPAYITPTTYSNRFDGTGDFLTISGTSTACALPGDFTIECWLFNNITTAYGTLWSTTASVDTTNGLRISTGNSNNLLQVGSALSGLVNSSTAFSNGTWVHVAVVRSGTTLTIYQNGVNVGSVTNSQSFVSDTFYVGNATGTGSPYPINGLLSNLRVVKGTALYTTNFTPPSGPLTAVPGTSLLTCQSSTLIDNSANNFTLTANGDIKPVASPTPFPPKVDQTSLNSAYSTSLVGGSAFFDGTGDYLRTDTSTSFALNTSDFTFETWLYPTVAGNDSVIIDNRNPSGGTNGFAVSWASSNYVRVIVGAPNTWDVDHSTAAVGSSSWTHYALTRSGTTFRVFLNGVLSFTSSAISGSLGTTAVYATVGAAYNAANPFTGYLSGTRLIKGTALYTSSFAPPIAPPIPVTNTSVLLNYTNAGIFNQTGTENFEAVSNDPPKISTLQSKWGGSSIAFNSANTGSSIPYLLANRHTNHHAFYGGDFTVEAWVYILANNDLGGPLPIVNYGNGGANGPLGIATAWSFNVQNNGAGIQFYRNTDASTEVNVSFTGTVPYNQWAHVAVSRTGTSMRAFVNGIQIGSTASSSTSYAPISGTNRLFVGAGSGGGGNAEYYKFPGYMQDVRVTKGIARYTSNFIPPTSGMQNQ